MRTMTFVKAERRIKMFEAAISKQSKSAHELASDVFLSKRWVVSYLNHLHEHGKIHIESWVRSQGSPLPKYLWGKGNDAIKPAPMTAAEFAKRRKVKLRDDWDTADREKARRIASRLKPVRTADIAALFGEPA